MTSAASADPRFFGRVAKVTCWRETIPLVPTLFHVERLPNQTEIEDLRIQFKIRRNLTKNPDQCTVTITNLADTTRHELETKPLLLSLEAGYVEPGAKQIFTGDMRFAMSEQKGPNWETMLELGDGDCHHRWSRTNKSYAPGTTVRTMLKDASNSLGLQLPAELANDKALDEQYVHGSIMFGPTRDEMTRLLQIYGYHWVIQNGQLQVLRDDQLRSNEAFLIDESDNGMIGTPEYGSPPRSGKPPHIFVKMFLRPEIFPGALVELKSRDKNGFFRVESTDHDGDTHGTPWETKLEIKPFQP